MGIRENAIRATRDYLRSNPRELSRGIRSLLGLRASIPLPAFRWLADQVVQSGKVKTLRVSFPAPGIAFTADVDLMDTPVRASAAVYFERVVCSDEELTFAMRIEDVSLELTDHAETPVAMLIASGALDLSNPGDLVAYLPQRPPVLVEAEGRRITLDLMRDPNLGKNPRVRQVAGLLTAFLTVHNIETGDDHLDIVMRGFPRGYLAASKAVHRHVVQPALKRYLPALAR
jgi:hypothetical protein